MSETTAVPQLDTPDTLSLRLGLAANIVAAVKSGRSLNDVFPSLNKQTGNIKASVQEMVYNTLRRYGRGEFQLSCLLKKPLSDPEIHALLLVSLSRLDLKPESAHTIVNQAVDRASSIAEGAFQGLVNGVLRNYLRQQASIEQQIETTPVARYWYPEWWLTRIQNAYPDDWETLAQTGNRHPPMSLRVNRRKNTPEQYMEQLLRENIGARLVPPDAILLDKPQPIERLPGFFSGLISIQDIGAQYASQLLDVHDGMRTLDACAAPGGKTAHLLEKADLDLLALDSDAKRCQRIDDNLQRLGLNGYAKVLAADCRLKQDWWDGRYFDRILADVPCSASGVVRRHADSKWLRRESDLRNMVTTQRQILKTLWPLLSKNGKFLYATCSVFSEENSEQITAFLNRHPDARCLEAKQLLPNNEHDGFYYALLQKIH